MLQHFFQSTLRNMRKNSVYSLLNIFGLSIGIVCAGFIFLWIEDEYNYDRYFRNGDNIYMVKNQQTDDQSVITIPYTPGPLAPAMQSDIPGIRNIARSSLKDKLLFKRGEKSIFGEGCVVDPSFFSLFRLQFLYGQPATAFQQLQSVVISEKMAKAIFGDTLAYGKTITIGNNREYVITGIIKDLPSNVSLKFDYLLPYEGYVLTNPSLKNWGNQLITWVELNPTANVTSINKKLGTFVHDKEPSIGNEKMMLYPLNRLRLFNSFDKTGNETDEGRIKYVRMFSIIGLIILVIACINFMNLATARSEKGLKKSE